MKYQQTYTDLELLGREMDLDDALDSVIQEMTEHFVRVNDVYCQEKYTVWADFCLGFPASDHYDPVIAPLIPLASHFITLRYALNRSPAVKEKLLRMLLNMRAKVQSIMKSL